MEAGKSAWDVFAQKWIANTCLASTCMGHVRLCVHMDRGRVRLGRLRPKAAVSTRTLTPALALTTALIPRPKPHSLPQASFPTPSLISHPKPHSLPQANPHSSGTLALSMSAIVCHSRLCVAHPLRLPPGHPLRQPTQVAWSLTLVEEGQLPTAGRRSAHT